MKTLVLALVFPSLALAQYQMKVHATITIPGLGPATDAAMAPLAVDFDTMSVTFTIKGFVNKADCEAYDPTELFAGAVANGTFPIVPSIVGTTCQVTAAG